MKYPKTLHFSFSENLQNDDRKLPSDDIFVDKIIVCSEKIDGECTGMTSETCHARSLDSRDHPSRHWIKGLHGSIQTLIPKNIKIFGEMTFAKHSIFYDRLTTYFYVFSVWEGEICLPWDETKNFCKNLGLETVPELYVGPWNLAKVQACWSGKSAFGDEQEGYVVRNFAAFPLSEFERNMAKFVRKAHVRTDEFWKKNWVPNQIGKDL
jgi:hypothetical protein